MSRIRTVKPEFWTHPKTLQCTIPARVLLLSMLNQADDAGRLYDQPGKIGANTFGEKDRVNMARLMAELVDAQWITRYTVAGRGCVQINSFTQHQAINKPRPSTIPPVPEGYVSTPGAVPEPARSTPTGKGMEGKGMEGKVLARTRARDLAFEALCDVCGIDAAQLTPGARSSLNTALRDIRAAWGDVEDGGVGLAAAIHERAANYAINIPGTMTPNALAKHWPQVAMAKPRAKGKDQAARLLAAADEQEGRSA